MKKKIEIQDVIGKVDSFVFYRSFYESAQFLDGEDRLEFYDAIFGYVFEGKAPTFTHRYVNGNFVMVQPNIDNAVLRHAVAIQNGSKPKAKLKQNASKTEATSKQNRSKTEAKPDLNVNVNDNDNDNGYVNVSVNATTEYDRIQTNTTVHPTQQEVISFCEENNLTFNAKAFYDALCCQDWKTLGGTMRQFGNAKSNDTQALTTSFRGCPSARNQL